MHCLKLISKYNHTHAQMQAFQSQITKCFKTIQTTATPPQLYSPHPNQSPFRTFSLPNTSHSSPVYPPLPPFPSPFNPHRHHELPAQIRTIRGERQNNPKDVLKKNFCFSAEDEKHILKRMARSSAEHLFLFLDKLWRSDTKKRTRFASHPPFRELQSLL